jgi:hypothetical protein
MVNSALVWPAGIVTECGIDAVAVALLVSVITDPLAPAGPLRVTVPLDAAPPVTVVGLRLNEARASGLTVSVAVLELVPIEAVIVAVVEDDTAVVAIVKFTDVSPADKNMPLDTNTLELLEERLTIVPPAGAGPLRVTVPVDDVPPTTEVGDTEKLSTVGTTTGLTVSVDAADVDPDTAVMETFVVVVTTLVVTVKDALVDPEGTTTDAGTAAEGSLLNRSTRLPPDGAGALRVTVPVDDTPPMTDVGDNVTDAGTVPAP